LPYGREVYVTRLCKVYEYSDVDNFVEEKEDCRYLLVADDETASLQYITLSDQHHSRIRRIARSRSRGESQIA